MNNTSLIVKTVLLSTLCTAIIIITIGYIFRVPISEYITFYSETPTATQPEVKIIEEPVVLAVEKVNPAVVSVVVTKDVPIYERYYETLSPWGFFGNFTVPRIRANGTEEREVGGGTGFIVTEGGLIVTNHHVVSDPSARYSVLLFDGTPYEVTVVDSDPDIDIAVLQISEEVTQPLQIAKFGSVTNLKLGQTVIAIGNALAEFQNSVSVGVISGLARSIVATDSVGGMEELQQIIQTDAAINPGNSGGPLLNLAGEVIGVNVATSQGADNIGFAIPADLVSYAVTSVLENGEIVRPYLGVRYTRINPRLASVSDLPVDYGALVVTGEAGELAILEGSPAEVADLRAGDIIVGINGVSLENIDLAQVLRTTPLRTAVPLEIIRDDEYRLIEVTLVAQP